MRAARALRFAFACLVAVLVLGPLAMMFTVSLNPSEADIQIHMGSLWAFVPRVASLKNYADVLNDPFQPFGRYFLNTLIVTLGMVVPGIFVNSAAAFALAWGRGRYRKAFLAGIIAVIVIPAEGLTIPLLLLVARLGWLDTYQAQIVPFIGNAFTIFLFYQFFSRLPAELIEAARIDGARLWQVYTRIALPVSAPVVATVAILGFLDAWNAYLWPLLVTRGTEYRPLGVAMAAFFSTQQAYWGHVMAFAVLMSLPVMVVFLVFQRLFIASVVGSSVKG